MQGLEALIDVSLAIALQLVLRTPFLSSATQREQAMQSVPSSACIPVIFQPSQCYSTSVQVFMPPQMYRYHSQIVTRTVYAGSYQYGSAHVAYPTPLPISPCNTRPSRICSLLLVTSHGYSPGLYWCRYSSTSLKMKKKSCTDAFRGQNTSRSTPHPANLEKENIRNAART